MVFPMQPSDEGKSQISEHRGERKKNLDRYYDEVVLLVFFSRGFARFLFLVRFAAFTKFNYQRVFFKQVKKIPSILRVRHLFTIPKYNLP